MGTGDIPLVLGAPNASGRRAGASGNAIYYFDTAVNKFYGARAATRTTWVAWPPAGYVPHTILTGAGGRRRAGGRLAGRAPHLQAGRGRELHAQAC